MSEELHPDLQSFDDNFKRGLDGKNLGIPTGFRRLSRYVGIRRGVYYLIGGYTGCLSEETVIEVARKQITANTKKYTIKQLYEKFHGNVKKDKWNLKLPTRVKVYMPDKGQTSVHKIRDVIYSGIKEVYSVVTTSGKRIEATLDHRFMVNEAGGFKRLEELRVGDEVICKAERHSRKKGRTVKNRVEICGKYPYYYTARRKAIAGKIYQRAYLYRAIYDACINKISIEEFLLQMRDNPDHNLNLSDPKMIIHHLDGNPLNNDPSNLTILSKKEHDRLHAKTSNYGYSWVGKEKIISIEHIGKRETYDISCEDPYHNFIANDFVVHNSGKTTLIDDVFVLHPSDWFLENMGDTDIDLKILYFSMERKKEFKIAKWISRFIFLDTANIIPVDDILSWHKIASDEVRNLVEQKKLKVNDLLKNVISLYEDPMTPREIMEQVDKFAEKRGHEEQRMVREKDGRMVQKNVWVPDNPSEIVLIVGDHIGLAKNERVNGRILSDKETLDMVSSNNRKMRDYYNYSPVWLSQFNRDIANPMRIKNGDVEPMLEDFKGSGDSQEDAEVVMSLFDPMRYKVPDPSGYDLDKLRDDDKRKKYRSLKILKNSYGGDDIRVGLAFQPEIGMFKEMPRLAETTEEIYTSIIDNAYFLPEYGK